MKYFISLVIVVQITLVFADYWVPRPDIDALYPRGFRVTIPHEQGIQLFAFHGNINAPLPHLDAGRFSKDVLHRTENSWVFVDRSTELHVGDKINFWLYVQKDGLGYRYDGGEYWVKREYQFLLENRY